MTYTECLIVNHEKIYVISFRLTLLYESLSKGCVRRLFVLDITATMRRMAKSDTCRPPNIFLNFYLVYPIFYCLKILQLLKRRCAVLLRAVLCHTPGRAAGVGRDICSGGPRRCWLCGRQHSTRLQCKKADRYIAHFLCKHSNVELSWLTDLDRGQPTHVSVGSCRATAAARADEQNRRSSLTLSKGQLENKEVLGSIRSMDKSSSIHQHFPNILPYAQQPTTQVPFMRQRAVGCRKE